jgi:hypothetical protein
MNEMIDFKYNCFSETSKFYLVKMLSKKSGFSGKGTTGQDKG